MPEKMLIWFKDLAITDIALVGGKNASLGEMVRALAPADVKVPNGFAVKAEAYRKFLALRCLGEQIHSILDGWRTGDVADLTHRTWCKDSSTDRR